MGRATVVFIVLCVTLLSYSFALPHANVNKTNEGKAHHIRPKAGKNMVCYYGSWAVYRPGDGKFDIEDIDPFLCTHLMFGFAKLDENTWKIAAYDPWNELNEAEGGGKDAYRRFTALRNANPDLNTLLAIGGWNEGSEKYSDMAADPAKRQIFVQSAVEFIQKYGFQGMDMDWEYPTFRGGSEDDKLNFASLLRELKAGFSAAGLLLTSAVSAGHFTIDDAYDVQAMIETLDLINVMSYDFHGAWDTFVHHNAPVFAHPQDTGDYADFNVDFAIRYWVDLMGAHSERLVMGLPLYGRGFTLDDPNNIEIYAGAQQPGIEGPYTRQGGILGYNEQCEIKRDQGASFVEHWQSDIAAKFVTFNGFGSPNQWYSFDDEEALAEKMKLINSLPIGGAMVWSIETDDFKGICGKGPNPLLKFIVLSMNGVVPTPDPSRTTTPHTVTTTTKRQDITIPPDDVCAQAGVNPTGPCSPNYVICSPNGDEWIVTEGSCPPGLVINPAFLGCDYPDNVPGCANKKPKSH